MTQVHWHEDGDAIVLQWGETAKTRVVRDGDDQALTDAYVSLVAEAVAMAAPVEGKVEREIAAGMSGSLGINKSTDGNLYVAWFPYDGDGDEDDALAEMISSWGGGQVPPEQIHMTLLYLGDAAQWDADIVNAIVTMEALKGWPREGVVSGLGRFVIDQQTDALVALADVPYIDDLRRCLLDQLFCYATVPGNSAWQDIYEHGYVPHFTFAYGDKSTPLPLGLTEVTPFTIDSISVSSASGRMTRPIGSAYADDTAVDASAFYAARDAYAVAKAGRILSGKNLTSLQAVHEAIGTLIDSELARRQVENTDTVTGEEETPAEEKTQSEEPDAKPAKKEREDFTYLVTKAVDEERFTFGPLYAPERKDAHGEWIEPEELQKATHDYVQACIDRGDNRLNLQHDTQGAGAAAAGRWVEVCAWPYETTAKMKQADGTSIDVTLPAGTVYMGVKWDDEPWQEVKQGRITGLSLGGRALRVAEGDNLADMGFKLAMAGDVACARYEGDGEEPCTNCGMPQADHA